MRRDVKDPRSTPEVAPGVQADSRVHDDHATSLRELHLGTVQQNVSRLAGAQAQAVTWSLAITAAACAASTGLHSPAAALAAVGVCLALWMVHATHLAAERAWRALYADMLNGGPVTATPEPLLGPQWARAGTLRAAASWSGAAGARWGRHRPPGGRRSRLSRQAGEPRWRKRGSSTCLGTT